MLQVLAVEDTALAFHRRVGLPFRFETMQHLTRGCPTLVALFWRQEPALSEAEGWARSLARSSPQFHENCNPLIAHSGNELSLVAADLHQAALLHGLQGPRQVGLLATGALGKLGQRLRRRPANRLQQPRAMALVRCFICS